MIAVICFLAGTILGTLIGIFAAALMIVAGQESRRREVDELAENLQELRREE